MEDCEADERMLNNQNLPITLRVLRLKILIFQFYNCSILIHDDALEGDNRCVAVE